MYTAAVLGHLDPSWISQNRDYVNTLVRDYANPSTQDPYFPVSRSFDWYHGHSWAHGLFETLDGKASVPAGGLLGPLAADKAPGIGSRVKLRGRHGGVQHEDVGDGERRC